MFFFIETSSHFKFNDLPKILVIQNQTFKLLCVVIHLRRSKHFVSIFEIGNQIFLVDDLSDDIMSLTNVDDSEFLKINISSALFILNS